MTDDFLKFDSDKFNIDDFQFDISSAIPENELLDFNPTAFTGADNSLNMNNNLHNGQNMHSSVTTTQSHLDPQQLRQDSVSHPDNTASSFRNNSYVSPINSPYTVGSHLSTSFQPQRKNSIYDTLESIASPQHSVVDGNNGINTQYFSPPPNRTIPLSTSRKSSHLGPSSVQTFGTSIASPGSFNDALSPYSSFDAFKSPRSMAASPAGLGSLPKQQLSKEEKLRRRREFHNQVERRRRDLIKEKIKELGLIVPPSLLYMDSDGKEVKASKSVIINKTVEYVIHLHKVMKHQEARREELLRKIAELELLPDVNSSATPLSQTGNEGASASPDVKVEPNLESLAMDTPIGNIKFETESGLDFDVNELLKQHSTEGWDAFDQN